MFIKYRVDDGYVVSITENEPYPENGYAIAVSSEFEEGDEFSYLINIQEVNENGEVILFTQVKQAPQATYLLSKLSEKEREIEELKQLLADVISLQLGV